MPKLESSTISAGSSPNRIQRALISVTDKSGIVEFAKQLAQHGIELVSTGGTARLLRESGIPVQDISELTGFPEMLDGRVKTLHPKVHGGILHIRGNQTHRDAVEKHQIKPIDMVVVNLYAFEKTAAEPGVAFDELIENIDIGGPSMIRSAAKNFRDVAIVTSPDDYTPIAEELATKQAQISLATKWRLAKKAFALTAAYDSAIASTLERIDSPDSAAVLTDRRRHLEETGQAFPQTLRLGLTKKMDLRYGENPHQRAALYADNRNSTTGIANAKQLQGKELSYNNIVDLQAAWDLAQEFEETACAIIKHTNPCGTATGKSILEAYRKALEADPVSAFGGVIGLNRTVDGEAAEEIAKLFVEAIAAPAFDDVALTKFAAKKNLRLLVVAPAPPGWTFKDISGGVLVQNDDVRPLFPADLKIVTLRAPSTEEMRALIFAWKVCKHVKSNAIVYSRDGQTVGIGAGQMSRVDACKIGAMKAALPLQGTVVASDAFFPFSDGLEEVAKAGATAVIQPGGSVRDQEVIDAANRLGLAMVFTGIRHFRH